MTIHRLISCLLACVAAASAAEVEFLDGEVSSGEITAEDEKHITLTIEQHGSRIGLRIPKSRIHRIRDGEDGEWRAVTARAEPEAAEAAEEESPPEEEPRRAATTGPPGRFGWRRDGSGHYPEARSPSSFLEVWSTPLPGWSQASPILVGDRIFVLSQPFWLYCIDRTDGEVIWKRENTYAVLGDRAPDREPPKNGFVQKTYGYTCPTPVTDGEFVYASFGHGVVVCYDLSGELVWVNTFRVESKQRSGVSQSPALCGSTLVIGAASQDAFAGYDRRTGEQRWSIKRGGGSRGKGSFQTVAVDGTEYVLVSDGMVIDEDGTIVQKGLIEKRNYGPTPVVHDGVVYINDNSAETFFAARLNPGGETEFLWRYAQEKDEQLSRSPLYHDGLVYLPGKRMAVLDAATGERVAKFGIDGGWSSPVLAGDRIVLVGNKRIQVIRPGRDAAVESEFDHPFVDKGHPDPKIGCTPVFAGETMYHRDGAALWCLACD